MAKQYPVRYGHNYKIVLALGLPCLLIAPFILILHAYANLEEWKVWVIIFIFLSSVISICLWLVIQVYPPTILSIDDKRISFSFKSTSPFVPSDFSFTVKDIISLSPKEIGGFKYYIFEISRPKRKFQISPSSDEWEDELNFNDAMEEIIAMLQADVNSLSSNFK